MVGQTNRLGPLQVGVTRDHHLRVGIGLGQQRPLEAHQSTIDRVDLPPQPQPQIRAHLVIAGAPGMELFAQGPQDRDQPSLHSEVHVLVLETRVELTRGGLCSDLLEATHQLLSLLGRDHPGAAQHPGMGDRSIQVLLQQGDVKTDRGVETLNRGMQTLLKALTPGGGRGINGHRARYRC